jgi:hypothetical protein
MEADVRWQPRFANYCRALQQLEGFFEPPELNEREEQGLIKAFEYTFELGWNTLRDLLRHGAGDRQPYPHPLSGGLPAVANDIAGTATSVTSMR